MTGISFLLAQSCLQIEFLLFLLCGEVFLLLHLFSLLGCLVDWLVG